jgi:hypothetical protein
MAKGDTAMRAEKITFKAFIVSVSLLIVVVQALGVLAASN